MVGCKGGGGYIQTGAKCRNALMAETVKRRLRDNLAEISEHCCSGVRGDERKGGWVQCVEAGGAEKKISNYS